MNKLRVQAEMLRESGYSYNMIHKALGVSLGTLSYWFKDKPFTPNHEVLRRIQFGPIKSGALRHEQKLKDIAERRLIGKVEVGKLTKRDLWMLGLGLYIGEGSKTTEGIRISNSDPVVIVTAICWLKQICKLSDENLTVRIHIYPDNNETECKAYWSRVTGIPIKNFRKTIIDVRKNKKSSNRSKLPHGTAHISVVANGDPEKGVALYRKIDGWIEGALNQV